MNEPIRSPFYRVSMKALILDEDGRFLLIQEEAGKWELPGGGLDWGESPRQGLEREIDEEMGLQVTHMDEHPSYFVTSESDITPGIWISNVIYNVKLAHLNFTPSDECVRLGFFTVEEAAALPLYTNVRKLLQIYPTA